MPSTRPIRAPTPEDLKAQVEPMLAIVGALGFPILRVGGVEADDVIGTLARQAEAQDIDVVISTGDKDFAQLVSPHISLVNTMTRTTMDREGVIEKFGVPPERIVDFLALTGDTVDNVPGVHKCGPKTAAKWIAEYGSLDEVIERADEVAGKIGENLRQALGTCRCRDRLVTIKTDVDLDVGATDLALREPGHRDTGHTLPSLRIQCRAQGSRGQVRAARMRRREALAGQASKLPRSAAPRRRLGRQALQRQPATTRWCRTGPLRALAAPCSNPPI